MITSHKAYEIASSWGSMMRAGDPGYVFYTFSSDKAVVQDETHRGNLIAYTEDCQTVATKDCYTDEDRQDLANLLEYFKAAVTLEGLDEFTEAYITAALWSSTDTQTETDEDGEETYTDTPMDQEHSISDIEADTLAEMVADCARFRLVNADLLTKENMLKRGSLDQQAGHDFWLARNHHGCGFWEDDDWEEVAGELLTKSAHSFGEVYLYVGDDGKVYA